MTLQLVAFNTDSCGYPRRAFVGPSTVAYGDLSPAEQSWSAGKPVMDYPADPAFTVELRERFPLPPKSAALELAELIASQPKISARQSPFFPVDTRRHEVESEARKARNAGARMLSLDMPATGADEPVTLGDSVVSTNDTVYTLVDPTTEFRIESEKRSALSGPLLRTHLDRGPDGRPRIRTRGAPWAPRFRYDRRSGRIRRVSTRGIPTERAHYEFLEDRFTRWMRSWTDAKTLPELAKLGRAMRFHRRNGQRPIDDPFEVDPYRTRFLDQELHEPFDEPVIEVTDDMAYEVFGRPLDLLYPEEIAELTEAEAERLGPDVPRIRHLRTHGAWETASAARLHSEGAEYLASAADILG